MGDGNSLTMRGLVINSSRVDRADSGEIIDISEASKPFIYSTVAIMDIGTLTDKAR
jgi:hypothetical protein